MPDSCNNEQQCCPPNSLGYKSCESPNLYSASDTETFSCEGQPDVTLTGRGVSSVSQEDADAIASADLTLQLAIYRVTNPCNSCTAFTQADILACGDQNWPAGPQSGLPYTNVGDNVTGWTNIVQGDFTTDGTYITNPSTDTCCDRVHAIVANSFTMVGKVTIPDEGGDNLCDTVAYVAWFITDSDNKRAAAIAWGPCIGFQVVAYCDLEADFYTNTSIASSATALHDEVEYDFTFSYIAGVLELQVDSESISIDLGCDLFAYLALGSHNETNGDVQLRDISIT